MNLLIISSDVMWVLFFSKQLFCFVSYQLLCIIFRINHSGGNFYAVCEYNFVKKLVWYVVCSCRMQTLYLIQRRTSGTTWEYWQIALDRSKLELLQLYNAASGASNTQTLLPGASITNKPGPLNRGGRPCWSLPVGTVLRRFTRDVITL